LNISEPIPEVLSFNINWFDNQVPYMDTLKFCLSIPNSFRLEELFEINNPLLK